MADKEYTGAFTGGRKPKNFGINPANQGNKQSGTYITPIDRLVEVEKYDLESHTLYCKDVRADGRKMIVHINEEQKAKDEEYFRNNPSPTPYTGMMGHLIDSAMKKDHPTGSRLILKRTTVLKRDNGSGYSIVEASNIRGVPNPDEDKTFYGLIGGSLRIDDEGFYCLSRISIWDSIRKQALAYENDEEVNEMAEKIEERNKNSSRMVGEFRETLPVISVQFRACVPTGRNDENGSPIYEARNFSAPFSWMPGPDDENGNEIKEQAHAMTGQEFLDLFDGYANYIHDKEDFKDFKDTVKIEATLNESPPCSRNKNLRIGHKDDPKVKDKPLFKLCTTPNFLDIEQTTQQFHDNYVVSGIVQYSGNQLKKVGGSPVEIKSYWVNNVHINGIKGQVHAFIRTSDGCKVEVAKELKLDYNFNSKKNDTKNEKYSERVNNSSSQEEKPTVQKNDSHSSTKEETATDVVSKSLEGPEDDIFNFFEDNNKAAKEVVPEPTRSKRFSRGKESKDEE